MTPHRHDNHSRTAAPTVYLLCVALGCGAAWGIGDLLLGLAPAWWLLATAACGALLGGATGENLGEAIIMSVLIALLGTLLYRVAPQGAFRAGMVGAASGFCVGKLVYGIWKEL